METTNQGGQEVNKDETKYGQQYGVKASPGTKHDDSPDKRRWELLPVPSVEATLEVLEFGAQKYHPWNFVKGIQWSRCYAAAMRHLSAWFMGETYDPESGLNHLAHAGCMIWFLLWYAHHNMDEFDDRPMKEGDDDEEEQVGPFDGLVERMRWCDSRPCDVCSKLTPFHELVTFVDSEDDPEEGDMRYRKRLVCQGCYEGKKAEEEQVGPKLLHGQVTPFVLIAKTNLPNVRVQFPPGPPTKINKGGKFWIGE